MQVFEHIVQELEVCFEVRLNLAGIKQGGLVSAPQCGFPLRQSSPRHYPRALSTTAGLRMPSMPSTWL